MRKAKASLIATIAIGLLAISTAGVSTYAWFQASSQVQIQASSSSTTITVNKPDDFTFYAYKGNKLSTWPNKGTFGYDFVSVTSSTLAEYTSFTSFVPGQNFVYCVKAQQASSLQIYIKKIISNNATKQGLPHERLTWSSNSINVGWAIDIFEYDEVTNHDVLPSTNYLTLVSTLERNSNYPDRFDFSETNNRTVLEASGTGSSPEKVITLSSDIGIYDNSVSTLNYGKTTSALNNTKDVYAFFSVVYSDSSDTYYQEVKSGSDSTPVVVSPTDRDRYFQKDDENGNSNCYAGLRFALNQITVTIG